VHTSDHYMVLSDLLLPESPWELSVRHFRCGTPESMHAAETLLIS